MTQLVKGLTVVLEKDMRDDVADEIINAIQMIKGVSNVTATVLDHSDYMNRSRIKRELAEKLWKALEEDE